MLQLIALVNSLDPDQAQQNGGPHLDPNCFDTYDCVPEFCLEKINFKKSSYDQKA